MARTPTAQSGSRVWHWVKRGLLLLGIGLVALVVLLLVALDLKPTRELVRTRVNGALSELFTGQVLIDRIGSLRLDAIGGIDAHVLDAQRHTVATVRGLRVRSNWPAMVQSLLLGRPLDIVLEPLSVDQLDVLLLADKDGIPTLASAFDPRHPEPASTPTSDEAPTSIAIGDLHVRHLWAHGSLPSVPVIDADFSNLRGSFQYGVRGLAAKVSGGHLRARGLPARVDPSGALTGNVALPPEKDAAFAGAARFVGTLASAPATLSANWKGPALEATLLAPAVPPAILRDLLPNSKLEGTTSIDAHVHGRLPRLDFDAQVSNPALAAKLEGHATLEEVTQISAQLIASNVDLQPILGDAPKTRLSANLSAQASIASGGAVHGDYRVSVAPGRVAANDTPSLSSTGKLVRDDAGTLRIDGQLEVEEPGAPTHANYHLSLPTAGKSSLNADVTARLSAPPRLRRLAQLQATGPINANLALDLTSNQLSARVTSQLTSVVHPSARIGSLALTLNAAGALASPELELKADARDVAAADRRFQRVQLTALGKPEQLRIKATADGNKQHWQAEARLSVGQNLVIDEPSLLFSDHEGHVDVRARQVRVIGGKVQIDDLGLRGLGELSASGTVSPQRVDVQFTTRELDLARVSRLSGLGFAKNGKLSLQGKVAGPLAALQGQVKGQARELDFGTSQAGQFDIDLVLAERQLNLDFSGKMGRSQLEAKVSELDLPAAPFTSERLQALRGEFSLKGTLDLKEMAPALRALGVPLERARGQLTLDVRAENPRTDQGAGNVHLDAHVKSEGLVLVGQRVERSNIETPSQAREATPLSLRGVDFDLHVVLDPANEHAEAHLSLSDGQGPLLIADAEAKVNGSIAAIMNTELDTIPLRLTARAPVRAMEKLPAAVRPSVMRGFASFELDAEGTLREPKLQARFEVRRLQAREGGRNAVDLQASADYANSGGKLEGRATATRGGTANLSTTWTGNLLEKALSAGAVGASAFALNTDLVLDKFPLTVVPELSDNQVRGPLSGEVHLRGLGKDAQLEANFDGSGITVNRVAMPQLKASLRANARELVASFDATQNPGTAHAEFSAPSAWGARWVPELEPRAKVSLKARAFELEALSPVLMRYVSTLEGQLDADLSGELDPQNPKIQGTASLKQGVLQLPQLGQRFSDVEAKVSVRDGEIRIDGIQARGITGRLTGEARAKLNGTSLQSASAKVAISAKEKLPITFEGVMMGEAWGHANLAYSQPAENTTEIKIDVPDFRMQMPDVEQNSVQDLDPAADIRVGARRSDGRFVAVPLQPLDDASSSEATGEAPSVTRIRIHLGNSVWIDRGRQASVQLTGDLEIDSGAEQQVRGRIELRGGKLDVSGKQFEIERGVISFEGDDPGNPTITATARWDSPAEYTVYADYAGTVKNGKLKLRAEPSLTQDEILSLIMFGTPSGSMGSGDGGGDPGAGAAVGVAGGTATKGLNRAISDVTSLDVSTRIDTSTGSARPELVVQLTPRLTTRVTRAIGEPSPGQSPDRTFLTLELRLKRSWALSAVVGDHGASALDLIWRNRY